MNSIMVLSNHTYSFPSDRLHQSTGETTLVFAYHSLLHPMRLFVQVVIYIDSLATKKL
jgi:hypothetical protein